MPELSSPDSLKPVDAIETHISAIFFTPDRVYKMLKPVETSFMSFKDRDVRLAQTTREFELNHRISPSVYLGLADVAEGSELMERVIVMRRLPEDRQLDRLSAAPGFENHLREIARFVAAFHSRQEPITGEAAEIASVASLRQLWSDNFQTLAPIVGPVIPNEDNDEIHHLVDRYLGGRSTLLAERVAAGRIRDGHGDLRAEHVFCLEEGPQVIDCVAFRDDFRVADVLNDASFLAMDLHRLAGAAAASKFIRYYDEFSNEHHPSTLAHHYVAYRAHVRAKVAAVRYGQGDVSAASEARIYHNLALTHLRVGQVRLVLVGGGAGAGKSTVAEGLAERLGATWLRSDEIRKSSITVDPDRGRSKGPGIGIYSAEASGRVYRELVGQAEMLLTRGESVVLDATWSDESYRAIAREMADRSATVVTEIECKVPLSIAKERIERRVASVYNVSDATPEVADFIAANFQDWPSARSVDTSRSIAASIDDAHRLVIGEPTKSLATEPTQEITVDGRLLLSYESIRFYLSKDSGFPTVSGFGEFTGTAKIGMV